MNHALDSWKSLISASVDSLEESGFVECSHCVIGKAPIGKKCLEVVFGFMYVKEVSRRSVPLLKGRYEGSISARRASYDVRHMNESARLHLV